jgi:hypothetical protein
MAQAYTPDELRALSPAGRGGLGRGTLAFLFVGVLVLLALWAQTAPSPQPSNAPATEFSAARALDDVRQISQQPHPVGTEAHDAVRGYLLRRMSELGLEPEVQTTGVLSQRRSNALRAARVENIVGVLKGSNGAGRPLLFAAHYDSAPTSKGASDDAASVAALLETARALKAGPQLKNDVVFLFTDAEEVGLLGARAFVEQHPLAKQVGVALNFEARGTSGPSMMFETSEGNGQLVGEWGRAVSRPHATSLSYEIYRRMPNDTDFSVFKEAGLPGLNFAFIDGLAHYHTQSDSAENLDARSLQHQGANALGLAKHFGNLSLDAPRTGNAVYFDLLGRVLLSYPTGLVLPLTALAAILFAVVLWLGFRRGRVTTGGVLLGALALILSAALAAGVAALGWWLVMAVQGALGREVQDDLYQGGLYLAGFACLALAFTVALYNRFSKRVSVESLTTGALLCWLLLLVPASLLVPGGSYLLLWPLLFSLAALAYVFMSGARGRGLLVVQALCAVPGVLLVVPLMQQMTVALGPGLGWVLMVLLVLLFGTMLPLFALMTESRKWLLPGGAALSAALLIAAAALTAGFDSRHPKGNSISYVLNADAGRAVWASTDARADEWTQQFFKAGAERGSLNEYVPTSFGGFLKSEAPALPLSGPQVEVLGDETRGEVRTLRLRLSSTREQVNVTVPADSGAQVLAAAVDGRRVDNAGATVPARAVSSWSLQYFSPPAEGVELAFEVKAGTALKLRVVEQSNGLPEITGSPVNPRPEGLMPAPFVNSDTTQVSKSYTF